MFGATSTSEGVEIRMNLVNAFLFLMNLFLKHILANMERSKISTVYNQSIVNTESKFWDELVSSKIDCFCQCLLNPKCQLGHYHPVSKRCALYYSNALVSNSKEEGVILVIGSRQVDECSNTNETGVVNILEVGPVFCENSKHGGGWTVFQRRFDGSVDFYLNWENYKHGFGDMNGEFWLGLEKLHKLTSSGQYMLRVDLGDFENRVRYALYSSFRIDDESMGYKLDIKGYSGNAGDSMAFHSGMKLSTVDRDNDSLEDACAVRYKGAWWYKNCHRSHLNGLYRRGPFVDAPGNGTVWVSWKGWRYSLKSTEMLIRKL